VRTDDPTKTAVHLANTLLLQTMRGELNMLVGILLVLAPVLMMVSSGFSAVASLAAAAVLLYHRV
jgi:hypothetical protein